jgi:hypothetical protein
MAFSPYCETMALRPKLTTSQMESSPSAAMARVRVKCASEPRQVAVRTSGNTPNNYILGGRLGLGLDPGSARF